MKNKLLVFLLVVTGLFNWSYADFSLKKGVDYTVISGVSSKTKVKAPVVVQEFFSFQCIHCKDLEPLIDKYVANNSKKVKLEKIHVVWNDDPNTKNFAKLCATLQKLGLNKLFVPVFDAIFNRQNLANPVILKTFLANNKLKKEQIDNFFKVYNDFEVDTIVRNYKTMTLNPLYNLSGTPTIIVGGKYMVMPAQPAKLVEVTAALVNMINSEKK